MRKKQMMIEIGPDLARFEGEPRDGDESTLLVLTTYNIVFFTKFSVSALTDVGRPPPLGRVELDSDKENAGSPVNKKRRILAITGSPAVSSSTRKDIKG
jgi:hypothetical protein